MRPNFLRRLEQRARRVLSELLVVAFGLALAAAGAAMLVTSPGIAP